MRIVNRQRPPETAANFFSVSIGEKEVVLKLPNFAVRQELIQLFAEIKSDSGDESSPDLIRAMVATVAACWHDLNSELETAYFEHRNDLCRYGDLCMDEFESFGFDVTELVSAAGECVSYIADSIPTETEVEETEDFSEAGAAV